MRLEASRQPEGLGGAHWRMRGVLRAQGGGGAAGVGPAMGAAVTSTHFISNQPFSPPGPARGTSASSRRVPACPWCSCRPGEPCPASFPPPHNGAVTCGFTARSLASPSCPRWRRGCFFPAPTRVTHIGSPGGEGLPCPISANSLLGQCNMFACFSGTSETSVMV